MMRRRHRWVPAYFGLLLVLALVLATSRSTTASRSPGGVSAKHQAIAVEDILGTWSGAWNDTVYKLGGSLSFTVSEEISGLVATGQIGLQSLGLGDQSGSATGTLNANAISFDFSAADVGMGDGTIQIDTGQGNGMGSVTAPLSFGDFTFIGAVTGDAISGSFDFVSPTGGKGVASLTRISTAVSRKPWGGVKNTYRRH
jgi:hypothetical protein